jgi:hypothetical protein
MLLIVILLKKFKAIFVKVSSVGYLDRKVTSILGSDKSIGAYGVQKSDTALEDLPL